MPDSVRRLGAKMTGSVVFVVLLGATLVPASASAASFNCSASALRGTILSSPAIEPFTANQNQPACANAQSGLATPNGLPLLSAQAAAAVTVLKGPAGSPDQQSLTAAGGLVNGSLKPLAALPNIPLPDLGGPVSAALAPVLANPQVQLLAPNLATLVGSQVPALLAGQLNNVDLLDLQAAIARVDGSCAGGSPQLTGSSQLAGLKVLGQDLGVNPAASSAINVFSGNSISLSSIDVSSLSPAAQLVVKPLLAAVPPIPIPPTLAQVNIKAGEQLNSGGVLTQRALHIQIGLLGQSLVDLVVGEATASANGVNCATATSNPQTSTQLALQCSKRRLVLIDVLAQGGRVRLLGAADRALIGQRVDIQFTATHKVVAHAIVQGDGSFTATAPLPPRSIRSTNRARYQAAVGSERSLRLKLARRMTVTSLSSANQQVTIAGRLSRPLGKPIQTILVQRRVSCNKLEVVKRIMPDRTGRFRVTVAAPPQTLAAVYRLATKVRKTTRNRKLYPTFTLPRAVEIR